MPLMSKVDLFAAIRRDSRAGMSVRAMAGKYAASRRTVRAALTSAWPQPRKAMPPRASKLDDFKPIIDAILRADLDGPVSTVGAPGRQPDLMNAGQQPEVGQVPVARPLGQLDPLVVRRFGNVQDP